MEKSCGIIPLMKDGGETKILLIKHNQGHWGFPKGHIEEGETEIQTAKREFLEETGIKQLNVCEKHFLVEKYLVSNEEKGIVQKTVKYFVGYIDNILDIDIRRSEICDFRLCSFDEVISLLSFDSLKKKLSKIKNIIT